MSSLYSGTATFADYFSIPDDGDSINASNFNVGLEALADRTKYLRGQTDPLVTQVAALYAAMQDGVWSLRSSSGVFSTTLNTGSPNFTSGFGAAIHANTGDRFDVSFTSSAQMNCAGGSAVILDVYLQVSENGGSYNDIPNAHVTIVIPNVVSQYQFPFCLRAVYQIVVAGNAAFRVRFAATVVGSDTVALITDWFGVHQQIRII